jgi:hypothetical protein
MNESVDPIQKDIIKKTFELFKCKFMYGMNEKRGESVFFYAICLMRKEKGSLASIF